MNAVPVRKEILFQEEDKQKETSVRPLEHGDIPRVAAIFLKVFRKSTERPSTALIDYLDQLYLGAPWHDPQCGSRVHLDKDGTVNGFLGIVLLNMLWNDRPMRAGVMGGFMVENREENRGVGMKMLRDFLSSPLDIFFSDTANLISLTIAQKLRFQILHGHSLEWIKVFQPARFGVQMLSRRWSGMPIKPMNMIGKGADIIASRFFSDLGMMRIKKEDLKSIPLNEDEFGQLVPQLLRPYALKPQWDKQELEWLLGQARLKQKNGPLNIQSVYHKNGELAGVYAFYGQAGGIAQVLNILPIDQGQDAVVCALIEHVASLGCVAVRGATHPSFAEALYRVSGVFYRHGGATVVRTPHEDVAQAIREGKGFFGGLTGEGWTRLVSEQF